MTIPAVEELVMLQLHCVACETYLHYLSTYLQLIFQTTKSNILILPKQVPIRKNCFGFVKYFVGSNFNIFFTEEDNTKVKQIHKDNLNQSILPVSFLSDRVIKRKKKEQNALTIQFSVLKVSNNVLLCLLNFLVRY